MNTFADLLHEDCDEGLSRTWLLDKHFPDVVVLSDLKKDQEDSRKAEELIVSAVPPTHGPLVPSHTGMVAGLHFSQPEYASGCLAPFSLLNDWTATTEEGFIRRTTCN